MQPPEKIDNVFDWDKKSSSALSSAGSGSKATQATSPIDSPVTKDIKSSDPAIAPQANVLSSAKGKGALSRFNSSPAKNIVSIDTHAS